VEIVGILVWFLILEGMVSVFVFVFFLDRASQTIWLELVLNCDPPDLCLLSHLHSATFNKSLSVDVYLVAKYWKN
jgi:hypothetical protein